MIKIKELIRLNDRYSLNTEYYILLVLIGLHKSKRISDDKLKGQLQSLRKGDLLKHKNTYHCTINNYWYNDESSYFVFNDISEEVLDVNISIEEFIKYIQLYNNKSYNYCVNIFFSEYFKPMYESWNPDYYDDKTFNETRYGKWFEFAGFPTLWAIDNSYYCHECGHRHDDVRKDRDNDYNEINDFIHNLKKGNKKKIPKFDLKNNGSSIW